MSSEVFITGERDNMEYKIFLYVCIIAWTLGFLSVLIDVIIPPAGNSKLDNFGLIYFFSVFLIARYKRIYKPFIYPTVIILVFISPAFWLETGNLSEIGVLVYIAAIIMCVFIIPEKTRPYLLTVFSIITLGYPIGSIIYQINSDSFDAQIISPYLYFITISTGVLYATSFIKTGYERERTKMQSFGKSLRELHQLSIREWPSMTDAFHDYLDTGCILIQADMAFIIKKEWNKWRLIKMVNNDSLSDDAGFIDGYQKNLGQVREGQIVLSNKVDLKLGLPILTHLISPIYIDGLFYGHLFFGWQQEEKIGGYELDFAELMAQNLGYIIGSETKREQEKVTRQALSMSEVRFRRVFENAIVGIAVTDLNSGFVMVNPALRRMLGYTEQELLQMKLTDTSEPDDGKENTKQFQRLINGKIDGYQVENKSLKKGGELINTSITVSLINDSNDKPLFGIAIIENITERKKSERKIRDLNKELESSISKLEATNTELESFTYSVSHDLRAPLRAINGFSKILVDEYGKEIDDEGKRLINIVAGNAEKMSVLIDDLLAFSRLSRQRKRLEEVDLNKLIEEIKIDLEHEYDVDGVINIPEKLPPIRADKNLLRQAVINLLSNALKFSSNEKKPEIKILGSQINGHTIIRVKDNGVGFDMKFHDKLFKVFQRLHSEREYKGTGVGLAIVERIINRHGGKIWASSEKGKGAEFTIELPN